MTPQAPRASTAPPRLTGDTGRHLAAGYGASWWTEGWRVFAAAPGTWIAIVVILLLIMFMLVLIPFIGAIAQTLLMPVFAGGVMLGCNALARGEPLRISHLFDGFASGRFGPLLIVGLVMLAAGFVLSLVVLAVMFAMGGVAVLSALPTLTDPTRLDWLMLAPLAYALLLGTLIGLVGFALLGMAYWFAPALVVLNGEEPVRAMRRSFATSWRNVGAMLVYGLIYLVLATLATIPLGLGWLVLAPVIAGSCYAGWRTIFA